MNRSIMINTYTDFIKFKNMLTKVKAAGFNTISLMLNSEATNSDYIKVIKEELDKNGIGCMETHLPCYDLLFSSSITDDDTETAIQRSVVATSILGANWAVFHPRTAIDKGYDWRISFEHNKEFIAPLLETAEKYETGIAVENIPVFPDCPTHRFYTSDPDDLCELVDYFKSDRIGICWDTSHANLMSFDQPKVIRQLGKRIKATHLSSNFKEQDWHLLPCFGFIDWPKIMKAFKDIGYNNDLNLEVNLWSINEHTMQNFLNLAFDSVTELKKLFEN